MADRKLVVQILGDSRQLERTFSRTSRDAKSWSQSLERVGRGGLVATVGFRGLGRSVAFASGAFLGGAGFVAGARAAIKAASDLGEEQNKTAVLFGRSSDEIREWATTTATAIGISERAALQAAGNFGAMFETLRLGDERASAMSRQLVKLGADLASFSNEDPSDMLDRLRAGLSGEAEPLRRFGILLSEARVQNEAYASGIAKTGAKLTEQQKVLARYNLILADSSAAAGDFARTSTSQANQERINAALREQAAKRIGSVLLPAYNQATRAVNKWLGDERNLARVQSATAQALGVATKAAKAMAEVFNTLAPVVQRINKVLGGTENTVKLLLTAFVASKIISFTGALTGLNATMLTSTTRATALRGALLRLGAIGVIAIAVEIVMRREDIDRQVKQLLRGHAGGAELDIPVNVSIEGLEQQRAAVAKLRGENNLMVRALDIAIAKFKEADRLTFKRAEASFERLRKKVDDLPEKKQVNVNTTLIGIDKTLDELAKIKDKSIEVRTLERGLTEIRNDLAGVDSKTVTVDFVARGLDKIERDLANLRLAGISAVEGLRQRPSATPDLTGLDFFGEFPTMIQKSIANLERIAATSKARAKRAFEKLMSSLDRDEIAAGATDRLDDNLRVLQQKLAAVQAEIRIEGRTKELLDQEAQLTADIVTTQRSIRQSAADEAMEAKATAAERRRAAQERVQAAREAAQANRKANQFEKIGLTREGGERTPSTDALKRRLGNLRQQIEGTILDTPKTQAQLANIAKVLAGRFGKVGKDVRNAILAMFGDIAGALKDGGEKVAPQTAFKKLGTGKLLEGIGLSPEELKELRQRMAQVGPGGTVPGKGFGAFGMPMPVSGGGGNIVIDNNITLRIDGKEVSVAVTKQQQRQRGRGGSSRRGVRPGGAS